jgi:hypothetical protein
MRHTRPLFAFWELKPHPLMNFYILLLLPLMMLCIVVMEWPLITRVVLAVVALVYYYRLVRPVWKEPRVNFLGYESVRGWWVYKGLCHDKSWIELLPQSRLLGPWMCLMYRQSNEDHARLIFITQACIQRGEYRALRRIFRVTSSERGRKKIEPVQATYQGPSEW